jgi:predicted nucleotidyltransferase
MKFGASFDPVLGSPTKLRLLRTLLPDPQRRWTGRELAASARVSTAQGARDLRDFLEVGIVLREVLGKSYSWRVNGEHVLVPELSRLIELEAGLRNRLVREFGQLVAHTPVRRAILFGSVARGDERSDSDVDLLLEVGTSRDREATLAALEKIRERVWSRYGNPVSSLVYTEADIRKPANPELIETILREGLRITSQSGSGDGKD